MRIDSILHPTDFSDTADHAREVAVDLATRHGAVLHLFHGVLLHAHDPTPPPMGAATESAIALAGRLRAQDPTRHALELRTSHLHAVSAFEAIMEQVTRVTPDLIVIGTHGRTGIGRLLIGSTAEKVLRHAPCNVLTVKQAATPAKTAEPRRILVPVDFSDGSARALDVARWLAEREPVHLQLLHVVEPVPAPYGIDDVGGGIGFAASARAQIEQLLKEWSGDIEGARWSVAHGSAATEIARIAENTHSDLVIMGTRGLSGLEHVLVGSVTERVCRTSLVPVLVARDEPA